MVGTVSGFTLTHAGNAPQVSSRVHSDDKASDSPNTACLSEQQDVQLRGAEHTLKYCVEETYELIKWSRAGSCLGVFTFNPPLHH